MKVKMKLDKICEVAKLDLSDDMKELLSEIEIEAENFVDLESEIASSMDIIDDSGQVHEMIDTKIDIYNDALWKWAADGNSHYIDDALGEGLANLEQGIISCIQAGQYQAYSVEIWNEIYDITQDLEGLQEEIFEKLVKA